MKVAAVQHDIVWEDRAATLEHLTPQVARAAATGAQLVMLTEMFATGFSMRTHLTAEPEDGPIVTWLHEQAAQHGVWITGSLALTAPADAADQRPTNTLLLVGPDGTQHRYDKIHPFSYAGEHERLRAGDDELIVELEGLRLGLSVCYDLRFAELYWGRAARVDAELIVANWPAPRRSHWRSLADARAIENQTYVVAVNRVGRGGNKLDYVGDSRIVDPMGEVLASAAGIETILTAELDAEVVASARERFPFQADRRRW
ncbi:MAG: nitrilase-related carbon-nitrogen hydrolase [Nitriliruptoraceae bacterium]